MIRIVPPTPAEMVMTTLSLRPCIVDLKESVSGEAITWYVLKLSDRRS